MVRKEKRKSPFVVALAITLFIVIFMMVTSQPSDRMEQVAEALAPTPELDVIHYVQGNKLLLEFRLRHFDLSREKMGQQPVYGSGYIQLYLDGEKVAQIFKNLHVYTGLSPGKHTVKVELLHHNHTSYGIEKEFEIQVPAP